FSAEHAPMRTNLNDRMRLYLSKAVLLSTRYRKLDIGPFENLLLGAALADEGKYRTSLQFYKRAVETSADAADKAAALRVYGRSLIASGRPRSGRWRMRKAARLFSALSRKRGYDDDKMNCEGAAPQAGLVGAQLRWNYRKKTRGAFADRRRSITRIRAPGPRQSLEEALAEITGLPHPPVEPASSLPPSPTPAPAPAPALAPAPAAAAPNITSEVPSEVAGPTPPPDHQAPRRAPSLPPTALPA